MYGLSQSWIRGYDSRLFEVLSKQQSERMSPGDAWMSQLKTCMNDAIV